MSEEASDDTGLRPDPSSKPDQGTEHDKETAPAAEADELLPSSEPPLPFIIQSLELRRAVAQIQDLSLTPLPLARTLEDSQPPPNSPLLLTPQLPFTPELYLRPKIPLSTKMTILPPIPELLNSTKSSGTTALLWTPQPSTSKLPLVLEIPLTPKISIVPPTPELPELPVPKEAELPLALDLSHSLEMLPKLPLTTDVSILPPEIPAPPPTPEPKLTFITEVHQKTSNPIPSDEFQALPLVTSRDSQYGEISSKPKKLKSILRKRNDMIVSRPQLVYRGPNYITVRLIGLPPNSTYNITCDRLGALGFQVRDVYHAAPQPQVGRSLYVTLEFTSANVSSCRRLLSVSMRLVMQPAGVQSRRKIITLHYAQYLRANRPVFKRSTLMQEREGFRCILPMVREPEPWGSPAPPFHVERFVRGRDRPIQCRLRGSDDVFPHLRTSRGTGVRALERSLSFDYSSSEKHRIGSPLIRRATVPDLRERKSRSLSVAKRDRQSFKKNKRKRHMRRYVQLTIPESDEEDIEDDHSTSLPQTKKPKISNASSTRPLSGLTPPTSACRQNSNVVISVEEPLRRSRMGIRDLRSQRYEHYHGSLFEIMVIVLLMSIYFAVLLILRYLPI